MARTPELRIGDTWEGEVSVEDGGAPVDLTGATVEVQFRRPEGPKLADAVIDDTDFAAGIVRWSVAAATTSAFTKGAAVYGVRITRGTVVSTVLEERVEVRLAPVRSDP